MLPPRTSTSMLHHLKPFFAITDPFKEQIQDASSIAGHLSPKSKCQKEY